MQDHSKTLFQGQNVQRSSFPQKEFLGLNLSVRRDEAGCLRLVRYGKDCSTFMDYRIEKRQLGCGLSGDLISTFEMLANLLAQSCPHTRIRETMIQNEH